MAMQTSIIGEFETYIRTELGLSQETLLAYKRDVQELLNFIGVQELTPQLVDTFIGHLQKRRLKSTTVRRKCMSIRCWCHHLISLGRLNPNTLDTIDSIRIKRRIPDALESKAVDALVATVEKRVPLLRAINVRRDVSIILILYHSGLRVSELCDLNLGDINFAKKEIRVKGKGGCDRMVPTTSKCVEAIRAYLDFDRQSKTNAMFIKSSGQRITRRAVSDMLMSLSRRAGVKHTTAHMLRRSCATSLLN
jgi:site-specific recombinase XerD